MAKLVETTLELDRTPSQIDIGEDIEIIVKTNAYSYNVTSDSDFVAVNKLQGGKFRLTGVRKGQSSIEIRATADGGTEKVITFVVNCIITETTLSINEQPENFLLGDTKELQVKTNAPYFTFISDDPDVMRVDESGRMTAIGLGSTRVTLKAQKPYSIEKVITWGLDVKFSKPVNNKGTAVGLKLVNVNTRRTVNIETSNNESTEDLTIKLPNQSGTLITEETFTTESGIIATPYITTPVTGTENYRGKFTTTPAEVMSSYTKGHTHTIWEVARDKDFNNIVYRKKASKIDNKGDLCSTWLHDAGMGAFFIRCKHVAGEWESGWSPSVYVSLAMPTIHNISEPTKIFTNPEISKYTPPPGIKRIRDLYDGCYYGIINHDQLDGTYEYRGTFEDIKNNFNKDRYNEPDRAHVLLKSKAGWQYWQDGELYRAIVDMNPTDVESMVTPGSDPTKWLIEDRTTLPTPDLVLEHIGLGHGLNDNNASPGGVNTGNVKILGDKENTTDGYLMYSYKGKLCWTTPKPICSAVSWTDIAKRDHNYNMKTARFGKYLYHIRMIYEDEYKELFHRLQDGTYDNRPGTDFGIDKTEWVYDTKHGTNRRAVTSAFPVEPAVNENRPTIELTDMEELKTSLTLNNHVSEMMVDQIQTLNVTTSAGTYTVESDDSAIINVAVDGDTRKLYALKEGTVNITIKARETDKTERVLSYQIVVKKKILLPRGVDVVGTERENRAFRFVLEYIEEGCAPYNNLGAYYGDNVKFPENNEFYYDRASDTGYFGMINPVAFLDRNTVVYNPNIRFSGGTDGDWHPPIVMFYYHGMLVYMICGYYRDAVKILDINRNNVNYGYDMCSIKEKIIPFRGHEYWVTLMTQTTQNPFRQDLDNTNNTNNKLRLSHIEKELTKHCMFGELWQRMSDYYGGYRDDTSYHSGGLLHEQYSVQRGRSFKRLSTREAQVAYDRGGRRGSWHIGRDVSSIKGNQVSHMLANYRGHHQQYSERSVVDNSDTNSCWRPTFVAKPKFFRALNGEFIDPLQDKDPRNLNK